MSHIKNQLFMEILKLEVKEEFVRTSVKKRKPSPSYPPYEGRFVDQEENEFMDANGDPHPVDHLFTEAWRIALSPYIV